MEETIKVKVEPLTAEAFRPFGRMLENKEPVFPEVTPARGGWRSKS